MSNSSIRIYSLIILMLLFLTSCKVDKTASRDNLMNTVNRIDGKTVQEMNDALKDASIKPKEYMFEDREAIVEAKLYSIKPENTSKHFNIIEISSMPSGVWRYLIYDMGEGVAKFKGNIDLPGQRSNEPIFRIEHDDTGKNIWFVVNQLSAYGTGIREVDEVWYSINEAEISEDLRFIVKKHEWMAPVQTAFTLIDGIAVRKKPTPLNNEKQSGFYVDVQYNIELYDSNALSLKNEEDAFLFSADRQIRFVWDEALGKFVFDAENSTCKENVFEFSKNSIMENFSYEVDKLLTSEIEIKSNWAKKIKQNEN